MLADDAWNERDEATREREAVEYECRIYDPEWPDDHIWLPLSAKDRQAMREEFVYRFGEVMVGRAYEILLGGGGVGFDNLQFRVAP